MLRHKVAGGTLNFLRDIWCTVFHSKAYFPYDRLFPTKYLGVECLSQVCLYFLHYSSADRVFACFCFVCLFVCFSCSLVLFIGTLTLTDAVITYYSVCLPYKMFVMTIRLLDKIDLILLWHGLITSLQTNPGPPPRCKIRALWIMRPQGMYFSDMLITLQSIRVQCSPQMMTNQMLLCIYTLAPGVFSALSSWPSTACSSTVSAISHIYTHLPIP